MKLTLPLPPPANHYKSVRVVQGHPRWFLTSRAKKFFAEVKALGIGLKPLSGPVALTMHVFRAQRRGDWDGFTKCVCDALEGLAYWNDSQISEAHVYRQEDKANPRVEVDIRPIGADVFEPFPRWVDKPLQVLKPVETLPLFSKKTLAERATPNYKPPNGRP